MRVLHVASGHVWGGIEALIVAFAEQGKRSARIRQEYATVFPGPLADRLRALGHHVHTLGAMRLRNPFSVLAARRELKTVVACSRPEVVVFHGSWAFGLLASAVPRNTSRRVFWLHGSTSKYSWPDRLASRVLPDLVIGNSRFTLARARWLCRDVPARIIHCPAQPPAPDVANPALREKLRARYGAHADTAVIAHVSRMERGKGHALLLRALARVEWQGDWMLWIVGGANGPAESKYLSALQRLARQLSIDARVRFLGHRDDVPALLNAADMYAQPCTEPEGFGLTIVEALYAGLPVVATELGAIPEVLSRETGFVVSPSVRAVSGALRSVIGDAALRLRLGREGPSRAHELADPVARWNELEDALTALRTGKMAATSVAHAMPQRGAP